MQEEVKDLHNLVCKYYAQKIDEEMDRLWDEGLWDNEKNEAVLKEHLRTPYKRSWSTKELSSIRNNRHKQNNGIIDEYLEHSRAFSRLRVVA